MERLTGAGKIFEGIQIGTMKVPNRIAVAPFCTRLATVDGFATPQQISYWGDRACGSGLVIVEVSYIDRKASRTMRNQLGCFGEECHVGLALIAEAIHVQGAKAVLQLNHAGRQSMPEGHFGLPSLAPSAIPYPYKTGPVPTKEMTIEEIEDVIGSFARASKIAMTVGFDGVEFLYGHGYLVAQFLSGYTNKRKDKYGGSLENRARFGIEIIKEAVKACGPGFPICIRISADEYIKDGITLEESQITSKWFEEAGAAYISVSASNHETIEHQMTSIYQSKGNLVYLAEGIKQAVSVPVIAVGGLTPELAVKVIEEGRADMVTIGRGYNADPYFAKKMAEGRPEDIVPCIRCNSCLESEGQERPIRCDANFLTGRNLAYPFKPVREPRKVMIVGGGPGGLEAARVAALRGCKVKLYDENSRLGGAVIAAAVPEFMDDLQRLLMYYEAQIKKLGVEVILNRRVTPALVKSEKPDTLILSLGAKPMETHVPGKDRTIVGQPEDALLGAITLSRNVLLVGGNYISCQLAVHLAQQGKKVVLATSRKEETQLAGELEIENLYKRTSTEALIRMMRDVKVEIYLGYKLVEITSSGAVFQKPDKSRITIQADNVLLCLGYLPKKEELETFKGLAPRILAVGDCVRPRRIGPAIHEGFMAGYEA